MAEPPHRNRQGPPEVSTEEMSGVGWPGGPPQEPPARAEKVPTLLGGPTGSTTSPIPSRGNKKVPTLAGRDMRTPPGVRLEDLRPKGPLAMIGGGAIWAAVLVALVAFIWLGKALIWPMIVNSNVRVRVVTVHGQTRTPMFFPGSAKAVHARAEQWIDFGQAGQLAGPLPKVGTRVVKGEILARLKLSPQHQAPLDKAQAALAVAIRNRAGAQAQLKKLAALKQTALGDLRAAEDRVKAAHQRVPAAHGRHAAGRHGKRDVSAATKRVIAVDKKTRGPKEKLEKFELAVKQAQDNIKSLEASLGDTVLRAPFDGDVVQVKNPGAKGVTAHAPLLLVQDRTQARVTFRMDDPASLRKGEPVMISVGGRPAIPGMVFDMQQVSASTEISADLPDANGALINADPNTFRLVRGFAPLAFQVPLDALVGHDEQVGVWTVQGRHVVRQRVQVLEVHGSDVLVWDATATMPREIRVVHSRDDGHSITSLTEDTEVIPVEEPASSSRR